ncbi:MAG: aminoglycoside/hydroxyurea antibiotic resistance kinase [Anaerolineaceae bacterium]|nr:MAG: aminoglycoside/hydroxyurea antibiotic resistance kinase [Anaerolineaceae bacterium]
MINLPPVFAKNVTQAFPNGADWLADLPDLLAEAARRWDLTLGEPFLLSYNYVCAATRPSSPLRSAQDVVLKIGVPNVELTSEIKALRVYDGQGACRLLEADAYAGMLLLERLHPGTMLATLADDDRATEIAADVMQRIQRPVPAADGFLSLRGWFDELKDLRPRFGGGTGPFPEKTVNIVEGMLRELFAEERPQALLHGDFHHFNILLSERGWLVIDPKGVAGAPEYEAGPLLMNPWGEMPGEAEAIRRTQRRIAILAERLGFDRQRLRAWAVCHSLLSAWWDMAEDGSGGEYSRAWTEIFLKTRV